MKDIEIFLGIPSGDEPEVRRKYLDEACGDDKILRGCVEALIAAEEGTGLMDVSVPGDGLEASEVVDHEEAGAVIGSYKLLQEIGVGGFGVVYMAQQLEPVKRRVALKIIKMGMDTRQVVARFEAERQALAMMDHPGIAKVLDAGATESGRPYFVMELVHGVPVTKFCDEERLGVEGRLALFIKVCAAVQHAHQKGVIHRDLKPTNVLVTMLDDEPCPKVIDFGVAKATQGELIDKTLFTCFGQFIGTPAYMSPEQAQMSGLDIDTRSDIYSLGVLLYELLTGNTPFDSVALAEAGYDEMRRLIREDDPAKPSTRLNTLGEVELTTLAQRRSSAPERLRNDLSGDLDWIIIKALEKDRKRRYETANALAVDIQRHLDDEPVSAAAPSVRYRMAKYARRNKTLLVTVASIAALLVLGTTISTWLAFGLKDALVDAEDARGTAVEVGEGARRDRVDAQFRLADELIAEMDYKRGVAILVGLLREDPDNRAAAERLVSALVYRDFPQEISPIRSPMRGIRIKGDAEFIDGGKSILGMIGDEGIVSRWDAPLWQPQVLGRVDGVLLRGERSSCGKFYAAAVGSSIVVQGQRVVVWELENGMKIRELSHPGVTGVNFSGDGRLMASWSYGGIAKIWNVDDWKELTTIRHDVNGRGSISGIAFNSDGSRLATTGADGKARIWNLGETESAVITLDHEDEIWSVVFSPDGKYIATGSEDGTAQVWSLDGERRFESPIRHQARVHRVIFSPDGELVATASLDGTVGVWDAKSGQPVVSPLEHHREVLRISFSHSGNQLLTACGSLAQVWDVGSGKRVGDPIRTNTILTNAVFSPDDRQILTVTFDDGSALWESPVERPLGPVLRHWRHKGAAIWGGRVNLARFSPDGLRIATATRGGGFNLWDAHSGAQIGSPIGTRVGGYSGQAVFSPDSKWLVTFSVGTWSNGQMVDGRLLLWKLGDSGVIGRPQELARGEFRSAEFSVDGTRLLASASKHPVRVWDMADMENPRLLGEIGPESVPGPQDVPSRAFTARFSPDGTRIAFASARNEVRVWSISDGTFSESALVHSAAIEAIEFSPDGKRIVTGSRDGTARVWDSATGHPLTNPIVHSPSGTVLSACFSPDGRLILTASSDGTARLWDADRGEASGPSLRHRGSVAMAIFSPDGSRVATASHDHTARLWDVATGLPISEALKHEDWVTFVSFSADGRRLVSAGDDMAARVWELPFVDAAVPDWFLDWVEAIAGNGMGQNPVVKSFESGRSGDTIVNATARKGSGLFEKIVQWYHAELDLRPITPFYEFGIDQYVANELETRNFAGQAIGTPEGLERAAIIAPEKVDVLLALGEHLLEGDSPEGLRAAFYARQALGREPENREGRQLLVRARQGDDAKVVATIVPSDSKWKWMSPLDGFDLNFASTFPTLEFDDSSWKTGRDSSSETGGFGKGDDWFDGVDIGKPEDDEKDTARSSAYFRHRFTTTQAHRHLELHCRRDDGVIVYLDGVEVGSDNVKAGEVSHQLPAIRTIGGANEKMIIRIPLALPDGELPPGEHILAISLYNVNPTSSDMRIGGVTLVEVENDDR